VVEQDERLPHAPYDVGPPLFALIELLTELDIDLEGFLAVHFILPFDEELAPRTVVKHVDGSLSKAQRQSPIGKARLSCEPRRIVSIGQRGLEGPEPARFPSNEEEPVRYN
jgi:hypothetical protein